MNRRRTIFVTVGILGSVLLLLRGGGVTQNAVTRFGLALFAVTGTVILSLRALRVLTLRDRRVGRRLLAILALATIVPILLMGALWAFSAWIGAASDRAQAAARQYASEASRLEDELTIALLPPGDVEARLRDVAAIHARRGERLTVFARRGAWSRVAGGAAVGDSALSAWPADSTGDATFVTYRDEFYAAARATSPHSSVTAIALLPARASLAGEISRQIGASVEIQSGPGPPVEEVRKSPFRGFALVPGWDWVGGAWTPRDHVLAVELGFLKSIEGFFRGAGVAPIAYVPRALMLLFVLLGIRVLLVNGQTLRALGRSITGAVEALRGGADALEAGRLEHRIPIGGQDELWDVAAAFNKAADGLERARRLEREQQRLENELALARRIQARLLPESAPDAPGLEIAGLSLPALEVGGDYYDHVRLGDGRVALVVADVSGKGVPAALIMSAFRASLLTQLDAGSDPARVMANVNRFLNRSVETGRFVTAFLAIVDGRDGRVEYVNAGHNPPFLVPASGAAVALETGGLLLAMLEDAAYERGEATLEPGATLAIYSDGAVEARDADGEMWGEERLVERIREGAGATCEETARRIAAAVRDFEGAAGPSDDLTLVLARRA